MWTRFHGKEISTRLNREDLVEIGAKIASLGTLLNEAGVQATVSDPDRVSGVFDLAKRIGGLVYVGFADSVIYACALPHGRLEALDAVAGRIDGLDCTSAERGFFRLALLSIIPRFSKAGANGGWLRWSDGV